MRSRRGQVHGRLEALEARQAARCGGPMVGIEDLAAIGQDKPPLLIGPAMPEEARK
ncbi:MAG: hypothetical protein AB7U59_17210 [Desulfovibrionaceae bacterium]